jgi:hypothetical protein
VGHPDRLAQRSVPDLEVGGDVPVAVGVAEVVGLDVKVERIDILALVAWLEPGRPIGMRGRLDGRSRSTVVEPFKSPRIAR